MGQHHHHVEVDKLLRHAALREQFGASPEGDTLVRDIVGERHHALLEELAEIAAYQWRSESRRGLVKGFFLVGPPGTGKTTLARRLTLELCRRFGCDPQQDSIIMASIDGAEIARSRYGESEERILDIFSHARAGFTEQGQKSVVLFDDVESIFMARGAANAKEWHFSQDSVFFHAVDELDTSRTILVLTSNRPDLVDEAIRDRFLTYDLGYPDEETLRKVMTALAVAHDIAGPDIEMLDRQGAEAIRAGAIRSLRDAQSFVMKFYVRRALMRNSLSSFGDALSN